MSTTHLTSPLSILLLAAGLQAQDLKAHEPFAYGVTGTNVGDLGGKAGGFGWGGGWVTARQLPTLAGWWALEDNATDSSTQSHHGVQKGGTFSTDVPAAIATWSKKSMSFNGTSDHIDLSAHVAKFHHNNMGTMAAWFKTTGTGALTILSISASTHASRECAFGLTGGKVYFDTRGDMSSGGRLLSAATYNDDKWHHVAVVVDRHQMATLYIDGVAENAIPIHEPLSGSIATLDTISIGRNVDSGGGQWYFQGLLDDVVFFGVPLTATEVGNLVKIFPLAILPKSVPGGPDVLAASLTSAAYSSRGMHAEGNRYSGKGMSWRSLGAHKIDLGKDGTHYVSMLLRREDRAVTGPFLIRFRKVGNTRGWIGWTAAGAWRAGGQALQTATGTMLPKTDYLVVLKFVASAAGNDQAFFKVYAPGDTIHASDALISGQGAGANQWNLVGAAFNSVDVIDRIVMDPGGIDSLIELDELRVGTTWEAATHGHFGSNCHGAQIDSSGLPTVGSTTFGVGLTGAPNGASTFMIIGINKDVWGTSNLPLNLGFMGAATCSMNVAPIFYFGGATSGTGTSSFPVIIPNDTTLVGASVFAQWAIDGKGIPTSSLVTTSGLQITVLR